MGVRVSLPTLLPLSFTAARAVELGFTRSQLRSLVEHGELDRFARGLYRRLDAPLADLDLVEIALRAPDATICLESALARHDLTDRIPAATHVALPRARRHPATAAPVRWHRFDERSFDLGRETVAVEPGLKIGLYSAERTLVDTFRLRHREGSDLANEALRRWVRNRRVPPAKLLELASHFPNATPAIRAALEVLL